MQDSTTTIRRPRWDYIKDEVFLAKERTKDHLASKWNGLTEKIKPKWDGLKEKGGKIKGKILPSTGKKEGYIQLDS